MMKAIINIRKKMKRRIPVFIHISVLLALAIISCASADEVKLTASDGEQGDNFGYSVSISGKYAIVGAYLDADNGVESGSAYIFKYNDTSWIEQAKINASDAALADYFGNSVSISGDYAVVGAIGKDERGENSGSAYIFKRNGTSWSEQAKINASDGAAADSFGHSVSISGDYVVVGAIGDNDRGTSSGSAYIFMRNGTSWSEQAKINASDGEEGDSFGHSVSISGDYVIVGAIGKDESGKNSGSAYIFKRDNTLWIEQAKINASDAAQYDNFGNSVSISGDYAVVGAYYNDERGENSGSAYIFKRDETSWNEQAKINANDAAVADYFGHSVSISGEYTVVGAIGDDDRGSSSGSAYIFKRHGTSWNEQTKINANDGVKEDNFGYSVSISDEYVVVGAIGDDDKGPFTGSAYVYNIQLLPQHTITIDTPTKSVPVRIPGGRQFYVNFTYTELNPTNYTVTIRNATTVINSITNATVTGGTFMTASESFYLNASAANGWYNVTVEMYDNSLNRNITHQNHSISKESYNASISQPENQITDPGVNATYTFAITNTGGFSGTFELAVTNHDTADVATLNLTTITNLASGSSQNVTLNVTDASAGWYNVTVNVTSTDSGSEIANTSYIMTTVVGPNLTLGNVVTITSDWGINFNLNHSVRVTNATASNVNVTYNVPWITDSTMGTIAKDETKWHNQTCSNSTMQNITVRINVNSTNTSAVNDTETFLLNITKRDINITSYHPPATQTFKPDTTFWIYATVEGEYGETFIGNATLVRNGIVVSAPKAVIDGNASFNWTESTIGTYDFSIRFYNLTNYFNTSTDNSTVSVTNPESPSGGGGGGVGISDEPENVEETVFLRIYLRDGGSSSYNFNNVVTSIEVTPYKTYGLVGAKIEVLRVQPASITTDLPAGIVYKYFNIFVGNLGWSEGKFSNSVVNFQVPVSWFEEYNIDTASVTLYRHHDGEWQPLRTTMTGLEGEYYQYSSPTPGFGTFVILGKVEESGIVQPIATADFGTVADPTPEAISTSTKRTPIFEILLGIIGIGILMAVYLRRK